MTSESTTEVDLDCQRLIPSDISQGISFIILIYYCFFSVNFIKSSKLTPKHSVKPIDAEPISKRKNSTSRFDRNLILFVCKICV